MERALRRFQPYCLLCPETRDLTTHHVLPVSSGHGLEPGNAVRLCRACNSCISDTGLNFLAPEIRHKLVTAAAQFKEFWDNGSTVQGSVAPTGPPATATSVLTEEASKPPDPRLVASLRGIEQGDGAAVVALADWLDERGNPRAQQVRQVPRLAKGVTARQPVEVGSAGARSRMLGDRKGSS
jgi:hypothetical protein